MAAKMGRHILLRASGTYVLDDKMIDSRNLQAHCKPLYYRGSHHRNLTLIYIEQNLFYQRKDIRRISLNSHCSFNNTF